MHGLPCSLYSDCGSHYFFTPTAGGKVDRSRPTQVGRALAQLGIEPAAEEETAFVPVPGINLSDILCEQEERIVDNDNTVRFRGLVLQIPPSPWRPHFAKTRVRVHRYHDGHLALFHGPRLVVSFDYQGHPKEERRHQAA